MEGAEWFYGGVGFAGKNSARAGGGCDCYNARFALDYFARSFAPEVGHYSVAVLDTSGNLILRVGRYGNVDDGRPLVADGGPPSPRSIGGLARPVQSAASSTRQVRGRGQSSVVRQPTAPPPADEVALFHAQYLATDTDKRLFIADAGNARIVSVKLDYHATERVALKDVQNTGR
jgi:hypothetical protein